MPLISILLPVYNAAPFLSECLDSILAQTNEDWELLAIDNASTDQSLEILQDYASRDPRIRVFSNSPNSIITALRKALQESKGQWITRMDADDRMTPPKLALMSSVLAAKGSGHLAVGLVDYFSAGDLGAGYIRYAEWLNGLTLQEHNFAERYKECVIPSPCWMCSKADLIRCGGFASDRYPEDYDLAFRFYQGNLKILGIPEVLHQWRDYDHRSSRTHVHYSDNRFLELKLDYFLDLDYDAEQSLVIWGAGKKGKKIAQLLAQKGITFRWLTDNKAKIGHHIYGQVVEHFSVLAAIEKPRIIISVAAPDGQIEIAQYLKAGNYRRNEHYFWFC